MKPRRLFVVAIVAFLIAAICSGCRFVPNYEIEVQGSGNVVEDIRSVPTYSEIHFDRSDENESGLNIVLQLTTDGDESLVKLHGDDNLIPLMMTEVVSGSDSKKVLQIKSPYGSRLKPTSPLLIELPASVFHVLRTNDSVVSVKGIDSPAVTVHCNRRKVTLEGAADDISIYADECDVMASDLEVRRAVLIGEDGTTATLKASQSIRGNLQDKSRLNYIGDPDVQVECDKKSKAQPFEPVASIDDDSSSDNH